MDEALQKTDILSMYILVLARAVTTYMDFTLP
jgi:hypothetical protein